MKARLALLLAAAIVAGCGSDDDVAGTTIAAPGETAAPTTTAADTTATEPDEEERRRLQVYFLRDGRIGVGARLVPETPAVGTEALEALLAGPTDEERGAGLTTALAAGTELEGLAVEDGVATVRLEPQPADEAARAQVVHTLTQFPTVERVRFGDGEPVARADFEQLAPAILVESPAVGEEVSAPLRILGTANTFEANFQLALLDADRDVLAQDFVTATSGSGERGTFDKELPFAAPGGPAAIVRVWEASAEDGSELNVVEIPVRIAS